MTRIVIVRVCESCIKFNSFQGNIKPSIRMDSLMLETHNNNAQIKMCLQFRHKYDPGRETVLHISFWVLRGFKLHAAEPE